METVFISRIIAIVSIFVEIFDFDLNAIRANQCENFPTNFEDKIAPKINHALLQNCFIVWTTLSQII